MTNPQSDEQRRISRIQSMHARSDVAARPLIVVGASPNQVLYVANRVVIEFSDDGGHNWVTFPGTENGIETDTDQRATLSDLDYPIQFVRLYRTYGLGELAETSPALLHTEPTDYKVRELYYEVIDLPSPVPIAPILGEQIINLPGFICEVSGRSLIARPKTDYADVRTARDEFESQCEVWRFQAQTLGNYRFGLQFRRSQCEGSPGGALWQIIATPKSKATAANAITPPIAQLLEPTDDPAVLDEVVRIISDRLNRGFLRREPVTSLAYWMRTVLVAHFGSKSKLCRELNISDNVYSEIGKLATRHDWREGRKVDGELVDEPLLGDDVRFLSASCRLLLHRLAISEGGVTPSVLLTVDEVRRMASQAPIHVPGTPQQATGA